MIVPIRKVIRRKDLLALLGSQFSSRTELGVELVEKNTSESYSSEKYRVYEGRNGEFNERSQFVIVRSRKDGRIVGYTLEGSLNFS